MIAVDAHVIEQGHGVYRYPLMGRYAQHRTTHVSPWRSGRHRHETDPPPEDDVLDREAWLRRLEARDVTHLYVQGADRNVLDWVAGDPRFRLLVRVGDYAHLYAVDLSGSADQR